MSDFIMQVTIKLVINQLMIVKFPVGNIHMNSLSWEFQLILYFYYKYLQ